MTLPVSVVIACHTERRWDTLLEAIESVRTQREGPERLIVAVDNNPALAARLRRSGGPLEIVENHLEAGASNARNAGAAVDRKSTRLNSSHVEISYAVFCL